VQGDVSEEKEVSEPSSQSHDGQIMAGRNGMTPTQSKSTTKPQIIQPGRRLNP